MKKSHRPVALSVAAVAAVAASSLFLLSTPPSATGQGEGGEPAEAWMDQVSYSIGHDLGRDMAAGLSFDNVDANYEVLLKGFTDGLAGEFTMLDEQEIGKVLMRFNEEVQERKAEDLLSADPVFKAMSDRNLARSKKFHESFAEKPGAVTLESGVQYIEIRAGQGPTPGPEDTVTISFRALTIDGREFAEGTHESVAVDTLTAGASEILQLMSIGSRWYVAVPPEMAYGAVGRSPDIGPNQTLVFDVELSGIKKKQ